MERKGFKEEYKGLKAWLEKKNIEAILRKVPNLTGIEDLLGTDSEGYTNHGSLLFYILPHVFGKLMENDPDKVLSKESIEFRKRYLHKMISKVAPSDLHGKELIIEKKADLPTDRPIIFAPNHGFVEDATSSFILAETPLYFVFGSLPQFFNSSYGVSAYLIGSLLINRKNKDSRRASIDKGARALELGANILICPEGTHNRTPNKPLLKYWSGIFKMAKKANAVVVPLVHLPVGNKIYSSRLPYIDFAKYKDEEEKQALADLMEVTATELYELMDKYAHTTRQEIIGQYDTMDEAVEAKIKAQIESVGKYYDYEAERNANYEPREIAKPEEVWMPIVNACQTQDNEIKRSLVPNYQRKF